MAKQLDNPRRFKVGERVRFTVGRRNIEGEIIEDRGNLGYGGVQIVRVAQPDEYSGEIDSASLERTIAAIQAVERIALQTPRVGFGSGRRSVPAKTACSNPRTN